MNEPPAMPPVPPEDPQQNAPEPLSMPVGPPPVPPAPGIPAVPPAGNPPAAYVQPPAQPAPPASKSLAWILGGCGVLLLLVVIGALLVMKWVYGKAEEFVKNPEMLVETVLAQNPDVEYVDMDKSQGTLRVKNKNTGKIIEVNFADAAKGKFTFNDGEGGTAEFGPGGIEVVDKEGTSTRVGKGAETPLPDWVPVLPQTGTVTMSRTASKPGRESGNRAFITTATPEAAVDFYEKSLADDGFTAEKTTATLDKVKIFGLNGTRTSSEGTHTLTVSIQSQGTEQTLVQLSYEHVAP